MQQLLLGSGGISATLPATITVWDTEVGTTATASFTMNATGTYNSIGNVLSPSGTWAIGGGASNYQFRLTVTSGTFGGAATGTWVGPSASPTWSLSQASTGSATAEGTLEIRDSSTFTVYASTTLTLEVEYF